MHKYLFFFFNLFFNFCRLVFVQLRYYAHDSNIIHYYVEWVSFIPLNYIGRLHFIFKGEEINFLVGRNVEAKCFVE